MSNYYELPPVNIVLDTVVRFKVIEQEQVNQLTTEQRALFSNPNFLRLLGLEMKQDWRTASDAHGNLYKGFQNIGLPYLSRVKPIFETNELLSLDIEKVQRLINDDIVRILVSGHLTPEQALQLSDKQYQRLTAQTPGFDDPEGRENPANWNYACMFGPTFQTRAY